MIRVKSIFLTGVANGSSVFLLILLVFVARFLGLESYGIFSYVFALLSAAMLLADFGLTEITRREIAKDPSLAAELISANLGLRALLSSVGCIAVLIFLLVTKGMGNVVTVGVVLSFAVVSKALKYSSSAVLQGMEAFSAFAGSQLFHNVGIAVVGALILIAGAGLKEFCVFFSLFKVIDLALALAITKRVIGGKVARPRWDLAIALQRTAIPIGVFGVVNQVYNYADTVMLGLLREISEVGLYSSAYQIYMGYAVVPLIISQAYAAQMARRFKQSVARGLDVMREALAWILFASVGPLVFIWYAAPEIVTMLYGQGFGEASSSLRWLIVASLFLGGNWMLNLAAISANHQKILVPILLVALVFNIGLNLFMIPSYGHVGAAAATFLSVLLNSVMLPLVLRRLFGPLRIFIVFVFCAVALAVGLAAAQIALIYGGWVAGATGGIAATITAGIAGLKLHSSWRKYSPAATNNA